MEKLDNSVSVAVSDKKELLLNFRDKYFAPHWIVIKAYEVFEVALEKQQSVSDELWKYFTELKNATNVGDYPYKLSIGYKKDKLIFNKQ